MHIYVSHVKVVRQGETWLIRGDVAHLFLTMPVTLATSKAIFSSSTVNHDGSGKPARAHYREKQELNL